MNRGEAGGLSYYRDRDGAEVDLIVENAGGLTLVDAKSGQTPSVRLFGGAKRVGVHLADPARSCDVVLAYGGDEAQDRTDGKLIPWAELHESPWIG